MPKKSTKAAAKAPAAQAAPRAQEQVPARARDTTQPSRGQTGKMLEIQEGRSIFHDGVSYKRGDERRLMATGYDYAANRDRLLADGTVAETSGTPVGVPLHLPDDPNSPDPTIRAGGVGREMAEARKDATERLRKASEKMAGKGAGAKDPAAKDATLTPEYEDLAGEDGVPAADHEDPAAGA